MADNQSKDEEKQKQSILKGAAAKMDWYSPALMPGENTETQFKLGYFIQLYHVFATNKRLIIVKRFPKNLMEMAYDDVELVEYYTNVEWLKSLYSAALFILAFAFLFGKDAIMSQLFNSVPLLAPFIGRGDIFGMNYGALLIFAVLLGSAIYFAGLFVISMLGCLRILLKDQAPFDISTPFSADIQDLIKVVESKKIRG